MNFREILIRAGKTFIQSFLGVLIPELCMVLSASVPDATFWTVALPPLLCAALAAGISAAWNIVSIALAPSEQ